MRPDSGEPLVMKAWLPNMAIPRPDELLYSVIARSAVSRGIWSPKGLLEDLFGARGLVAVPDLPGGLWRLSATCETSWGITLDDLIDRHTLFRYHTRFLDDSTQLAVRERMKGRVQHLHVELGICASGVRRMGYFRLCSTCVKRDLDQFGETHWRLSHHLPGVLLCAEHAEPLLETTVPYRPLGVHEHIRAVATHLDSAHELISRHKDHTIALAVARASMTLFEAPQANELTDYRAVLREHGLVGRRGGAARFKVAFQNTFPNWLVHEMFQGIPADGIPAWLDTVRYKPRRALHPLKHVIARLLLQRLVSEPKTPTPARVRRDLRGLSRDLQLRKTANDLAGSGLTIRAVSRKLGVAWITANRLLLPLQSAPKAVKTNDDGDDRKAWKSFLATNSSATRTELRRRAPALYARLYRSDRAWLVKQAGATPPPRIPAIRVDWQARDASLAARVKEKLAQILQREPSVRASRSRINGELQIRALIAHNIDKLPLTGELLAERCESVESFQRRRVKAVLKEFSDYPIADWEILRKARINPRRSLDGGLTLIAEAKSCSR